MRSSVAHDLEKMLVAVWNEDELKELDLDNNVDVTQCQARICASASSKSDA